jgi:recombination protein RecA
VLQMADVLLSEFQMEVLRGGLMGDACLFRSRSGVSSRARWTHGPRQAEYASWKASLFNNIDPCISPHVNGGIAVDMTPLTELRTLHEEVYLGTVGTRGVKHFTTDFLKSVGPLGLAIWYQDDFGFTIRSPGKQTRSGAVTGRADVCVDAMDPATQVRVAEWLRDTWGLDCKLVSRGALEQRCIVLNTQATSRLHALIAPFVHPSMEYKLLPQYRGRFGVEPVFAKPRKTLLAMPITKIEVQPPNGRVTHRFDIEVEGTHNYFVDGVMAHNSPEVTPGGRALKFYSSVRLDIRRIESIKDGAEIIGNRTRVKVVKNKCLAAGSRVFDPSTGFTHRIEDIVERGEGTSVVAADKVGKLNVRSIVQRFDQGEAEVIGLRLRDGTTLWVTPDHKILTDAGWREAGDLQVGDRLARPRQIGGFGVEEPVPPAHARMLGYLIGDGYVGGKTPVAFINTQESLQQDAIAIAASLGCSARRRGIETAFSHRRGEQNGLLALTRWAGVDGKLAPEKRIPAPLFASNVSAEVVGNLLFGIFESDGWISREQTGGFRAGFTTTSEQLAHQLHWLLLRFGIGSSVRVYDPHTQRPSIINGRRVQGKLPCWEVRVSGVDNLKRFAEAIPMWGPRGKVLTGELADPTLRRHRGSQRGYLPANQIEPVLGYLEGRGVTAQLAAILVGDGAGDPRGGLRQVLGHSRLRRDRLERLADALESDFLYQVLDEDVWYDQIKAIHPAEWRRVYDIEVDDQHTFVAEDVVIQNCSPPFRQCEFDIMYGKGISREGSMLDVAVDLGIVKKSGAWYTYEGEQLGQGRENSKTFLAENLELMIEISEKVRQRVGIGAGPDDVPLGTGPGDDDPITLED